MCGGRFERRFAGISFAALVIMKFVFTLFVILVSGFGARGMVDHEKAPLHVRPLLPNQEIVKVDSSGKIRPGLEATLVGFFVNEVFFFD